MILTLSGENNYQIDQELNKRVNSFIKDYGDMSVEKIYADEAEYQTIYDSLTSLPFLSKKKLVILKNPSSNNEFTENAEYLIGNIAEQTDAIFIDQKIDKRTTLFKLLKNKTEYHEYTNPVGDPLIKWLISIVKDNGGNISAENANYLIERLGIDQQMLSSEVKKILLYDKEITRNNIDLTTDSVPQSRIFDLFDSMFEGNTRRALALYAEQRALKEEPQKIIAMLATQLNVFALLISSENKQSINEIAAATKVHPYVLSKSSRVISRISLADLKRMISDLVNLDIRLKTEKIDPDEALNFYILNLNKKSTKALDE